MLTIQNVLGSLVTILGIAMILIGIRAQIKKNKDEERCGQPLSLIILALAVFICRGLYALSIGTYFIFIPDAIGAVFSGIILRQYFKYRK